LNGATAFVAIWYDQSGAGNHVMQTNASLQPTLSNNGKVTFDRSRKTILTNLTFSFVNKFLSFVVKLDRTNENILQHFIAQNNPNSGANQNYHVRYVNTDRISYSQINNDIDLILTTTQPQSGIAVVQIAQSPTGRHVRHYINGLEDITSDSNTTLITGGTNGLNIGNWVFSPSLGFNSGIYDVLCFDNANNSSDVVFSYYKTS
jgi:hypothetical protein